MFHCVGSARAVFISAPNLPEWQAAPMQSFTSLGSATCGLKDTEVRVVLSPIIAIPASNRKQPKVNEGS